MSSIIFIEDIVISGQLAYLKDAQYGCADTYVIRAPK
jgi:hypothetical protein